MSKTVYLLDPDGDFIAFGAGMYLVDNRGNSIRVGLIVASESLGSFIISNHQSPESSKGARTAWIQAIVAAPDGALLRWDEETGQVVDELAEDEDVFAEMPDIAYQECDEETFDSIEQKFLSLLAEQEPDHPWVRSHLRDTQSGPVEATA